MPLRQDGIFAALWTPADSAGEIIEADLRALIAFIQKHGVHGILALGSTGEFLQFSTAQRKQILEMILDAAGDLPVIANVSHVSPRSAVELARHAREAGAQGISLLPPWFYPSRQEDLAAFFVHVAEAAKLPLLLYNFPEVAGVRIEINTVAQVADRVPVAGLKQSGGQFEYHKDLLRLGREKRFPIFTGSDTRLPEALEMGVAGCFGGLVTPLPDLLVQIFEAHRSKTPAAASEAAERMSRVGRLLDKVPFPINVRACLRARGLPTGEYKQAVSAKTRQDADNLESELRQLFREWKLV